MAELKIEKIQDKEKVEVLSQCGSGTSVYSGNNCSTQAHPYGQVDPCYSDCKPTKNVKSVVSGQRMQQHLYIIN